MSTALGGFGKYMHALPDSSRRLSDGETVRIDAHDWRISPNHTVVPHVIIPDARRARRFAPCKST